MAQTLLIRDLTLRDGQQSLFATRLAQGQIDRVLPYYKKAGFYAMEVWGGAVPDSVMRFLNENPWDRLKKIHDAVGDASLLTALSRGRNLFGYAPYPNEVIRDFCRESIANGLGIMRIFDALNDVNNVKASIAYVKEAGGKADAAVCYTVDPKFTKMERMKAALKGHKIPGEVFSDDYFVGKAREMEALGADMITLKDMAGLVNPARVAKLIPKLKKAVKVPVDFHTHCTPGYGLASTVMAIMNGVDIVDTNIWYFSGGPAAPAIELIYLFCKKLGVTMSVNMEVIGQIRNELRTIREELAPYDVIKIFPNAFDPLTDKLPEPIDKCFDRAIAAGKANDEDAMLEACHEIEAYFNFPKPNELVKKAEIPGGMYTNMVVQLKQLKAEDLLDKAMELIPKVRLDAGLPPLVTPTSQIVGSQAVSCAVDMLHDKPLYSTLSNQFIALVKGEYGKTPVEIDPAFREKITGSPIEQPYDTSKYVKPENPELPECGGEKLAANEQEYMLLELFPGVAAQYLKKEKEQRCKTKEVTPEPEVQKAAAREPITGPTVESPMGGKVMKVYVQKDSMVKRGDSLLMYEAMKMENVITSPFDGKVKQVLTAEDETLAAGVPVVEFYKE